MCSVLSPFPHYPGNRPDFNQFLCVTILASPLVIASQMIVSIVSKPPAMLTENSLSTLYQNMDASTMEKGLSIVSLITKARRAYNYGSVPLTQDEQEQLNDWLAESDHNITIYTQLTDFEYLNSLRLVDLKKEKREHRKLSRFRHPSRPVRIWRLLKSRMTKLTSRFSTGK